MTLRLRPIRQAELDVVARLHERCFPEDAWDAPALAGVLAMRGADGRLVLDEDGTLLGLLIALLHEDEAEILTLGVDPAMRRRGAAKALLDDLSRRGREAGLDAIVLEVATDNTAAHGLYQSRGFRPVGRRRNYYRRGNLSVDAWLLRLPLHD